MCVFESQVAPLVKVKQPTKFILSFLISKKSQHILNLHTKLIFYFLNEQLAMFWVRIHYHLLFSWQPDIFFFFWEPNLDLWKKKVNKIINMVRGIVMN